MPTVVISSSAVERDKGNSATVNELDSLLLEDASIIYRHSAPLHHHRFQMIEFCRHLLVAAAVCHRGDSETGGSFRGEFIDEESSHSLPVSKSDL